MCGIIGYTGLEEAAPILLDGLEQLEYRGYDSAGLALFTRGGSLLRLRAAGRLSALRTRVLEQLRLGADLHGAAGLGHTRWATHGEPTERNAHPHRSAQGRFIVVHNGIIENHAALRRELEDAGVVFSSDTDTEVIAQLLEQTDSGNPLETLRRVLPRLEGSYALGVLYHKEPGILYCARKQSPLLAARSETGSLLASDAAALLAHTRRIIRLEDGEMARLSPDAIQFFDAAGNPVEKQAIEVARHVTAADKGSYAHYMRKEIAEQPAAVQRTLAPLLRDGQLHLGEGERALAKPEEIRRILFLGCGSAWHVGAVGRILAEELCGIPAAAELASEFRSQKSALDSHTLCVVVSQSGETADTLLALRLAAEHGARTLSIVNVEGSSIAEESGCVIFTQAGLEVAVATTKAYSTQLAVVYALCARLAQLRGTLAGGRLAALLHGLAALPDQMDETLRLTESGANAWAEEIHRVEHAYFIGRNLDHAAALEAALKLKEISYIHAEAYAAGELKHGTISLLEPGTPVVGLCCRSAVIPKTHSNLEECRARGAALFCLTTDPALTLPRRILLPHCHPLFVTSLSVLPMQLFAYKCADLRKCDIDKPRSLAKSVTVE
ncbi:MAG: glutamine--fructose-6-phosphate transaminase (isomerizing) [Oscillospiraceae bacterium]|jgi:glucosamine--fructose-6-phosphate aminotransferase (isomerizing)|nr:glutamine--fructose-6-phosphate transaminase (isomerizing) [Oscillospiraceae bacterium]